MQDAKQYPLLRGHCFALSLLLIGGVDDVHELVGLQGGAADQTAVHVGLGQQLRGVPIVIGFAPPLKYGPTGVVKMRN